jgi:hypothetical protein
MEPAVGPVSGPIEHHLLRVLYEEPGDHRRQSQTHNHAISLFIVLPTEDEVGGGPALSTDGLLCLLPTSCWCLAWFTLKSLRQVTHPSKMSVDCHWTIWHYISENRTLYSYHCKNLKSYSNSVCS